VEAVEEAEAVEEMVAVEAAEIVVVERITTAIVIKMIIEKKYKLQLLKKK
jgi:hypothetical protein